MAVRVLIVDDHELIRRGIRSLLAPRADVSVCGEAADGLQAVEMARNLLPDLVLMDLSMPTMGGAEATRIIRRERPQTEVIIVTQNDPLVVRPQIVDIGARGYISKAALSKDLLPAVLHFMAGRDARDSVNTDTARSDAGRVFGEEAAAHSTDSAATPSPASVCGTAVLPGAARELRTPADAQMSALPVRREAAQPERDLRLDAEMLAAIVASSDDAIVSKNLDGIITTWNKGAERMFGHTAAEAVGKHITLIIPPDRRDEETDILARMRRGERVDHFQTVRMRKDGTTLDISVTISPLRDSAGAVIGASKVARDVTKQMRVEQALRASEERLRALVNASSYVVYRMSPDWKEMRRIVGRRSISDTRSPRKNWLEEYIHPDDRQLVQRAIQQAIRAKMTLELEHRVLRPDGSVGWALSRAVPLFNENHEIIEWFGAASDVTPRKQAQEAYRKLAENLETEVRARTKELEERNADVLRQSEQLRALSWRLLRTQDEERRHIARELHDSAGQILAVLGMNATALVDSAKEKSPELAQSAREISELVQQLTKEIRTTSYLLHPPLLDESGLPAALAWYIRGLAERSGIDISFNISQEFGRLPSTMELVVFRLVQECLTNIHRHSGSGSAEIQVSRDPDRVLVKVTDHGKGISPEKLVEIQAKGSGLGIRGMRERLRQFDGEMVISSNGSGATVLVTIPISADPTSPSLGSSQSVNSPA